MKEMFIRCNTKGWIGVCIGSWVVVGVLSWLFGSWLAAILPLEGLITATAVLLSLFVAAAVYILRNFGKRGLVNGAEMVKQERKKA